MILSASSVIAAIFLLLNANESDREIKVPTQQKSTTLNDSTSNIQDSGLVYRTFKSLPLSWKVKYPTSKNMFSFPLDSNYGLSGTFTELRSNHFHAGLDLRTEGVEGKPVKSAADGSVVRIKVSTRGYGKVLYVEHRNGYQTVYGHLSAFNERIDQYVREHQYKQKKVEIELFPPAGRLKVAKGEVIAWSGNTGGSGGPHLHFETRYQNGKSVNPTFFGFPSDDQFPPVIKKLVVFDLNESTTSTHGGLPFKVLNTIRKKEYTIQLSPGKYAIGANWNDYYRDRLNKLGVNRAIWKMNGATRFQYFQPDFSFNDGRYINTHIDYRLKDHLGFPVVRLYRSASNPLEYYQSIDNGLIRVQPNDSLKIEVMIWDEAMNKDSVTLHIMASSDPLRFNNTPIPDSDTAVSWTSSSSNSFSWKGDFKMVAPAGTFYHPVVFRFKQLGNRDFIVGNSFYPMHRYATISFKLPEQAQKSPSWCILYHNGSKWDYEGGKSQGRYVTTRIRTLGRYKLSKDVSKPQITVLKNKKNTFWFKLKDDLSGIGLVEVKVDEKWIIYDFEPKTGTLKVEIPSWFEPGNHQLKISVEDRCSNRSVLKQTIKTIKQ